MKRFVIITLLFLVVGAVFYILAFNHGGNNRYNMIITSSSFKNGEYIPKKFSCEGGNINPEFQIQNVPDRAKSLALIVDDPDVSSGTFTHWLLWNINPETFLIKEESVPPGSVEGENDAGNYGYTGPCPPAGNPHHYHFKLSALSEVLKLNRDASKSDLEAEIRSHLLGDAELVGLYKR